MDSRKNKTDMKKLQTVMQQGRIQKASIASGTGVDKPIASNVYQMTEQGKLKETADEIFGVASLSKPVFTYLVLKLVGQQGFNLDAKLSDIIPFEDFCKKFDIIWDTANTDRANSFTPKMILSHQTGLPIGYNKQNGPIKFDFPPGKGFAYSGLHLMYLQECLQKKFGLPLDALARKYVFNQDNFKMSNSSFYPPYEFVMADQRAALQKGKIYLENNAGGIKYSILHHGEPKEGIITWDKLPSDYPKNAAEIISNKDKHTLLLDQISLMPKTPIANAANSLHTTASDYAKFCLHWMNEKQDIFQEAFRSKVSMRNDPWAVREKVSNNTLDHLGWGYGWGLEKNDKGEVTGAFHTGDMDDWRSGVVLDRVKGTATVLLTKSNYGNGHLLQDVVFGASHALNYFFDKFKFARNVSELRPGWQQTPSHGIRNQKIDTSATLVSSSTSKIFSKIPRDEPAHNSLVTNSTARSKEPEIKAASQQVNSVNSSEEQKSSHIRPRGISTKLLPPGTTEK